MAPACLWMQSVPLGHNSSESAPSKKIWDWNKPLGNAPNLLTIHNEWVRKTTHSFFFFQCVNPPQPAHDPKLPSEWVRQTTQYLIFNPIDSKSTAVASGLENQPIILESVHCLRAYTSHDTFFFYIFILSIHTGWCFYNIKIYKVYSTRHFVH